LRTLCTTEQRRLERSVWLAAAPNGKARQPIAGRQIVRLPGRARRSDPNVSTGLTAVASSAAASGLSRRAATARSAERDSRAAGTPAAPSSRSA
jgi:hypothetical protein